MVKTLIKIFFFKITIEAQRNKKNERKTFNMKKNLQLRWITTWLMLLSICLVTNAKAAGFDCAKATTKAEKIICEDAELSKLDEEMAKTYSEGLKKYPFPEALKLRQKQWLKRRDVCAAEGLPQYKKQCLIDIYQNRIAEIISLITSDLPCPELPIITKEAEKAQCLKRWLARHPLEFRMTNPTESQRRFCTEFYQALATASPEIKYIEPVLRTEDPQHPALERYRKCHDYEPIGLGYDYFGLDPRAHGFRLYRFDLDGNPENGLEEYLYEEGSSGSMFNGTTQYVRVDFGDDRCDTKDVISVDPQEARGTLMIDRVRALNAIVLFRGQYYIFNLGGTIDMDVTAYDPNTQKFSSWQCAWRIPEYLLNNKNNKKGEQP